MKHIPWTHEELQAAIPKLEKGLDQIVAEEAEQGNEVKPLPAMTFEECREYFDRIMDIASERPLTKSECFIHGQLLCCFEMAVRAEMLGKKGRYFVFSQESIEQMLK